MHTKRSWCLAEWRMTLARDHLRMDELSITEIAERVCYGSSNAFVTGFQRRHGVPPGTWRQGRRAPCRRTRRADSGRWLGARVASGVNVVSRR